MPYCTQLPCICAPNSKIVVLKTKPNEGRIHVLKGANGHVETPSMTVCGRTIDFLIENKEVHTSRGFLTEYADKACSPCMAWVKNGAPYYHN